MNFRRTAFAFIRRDWLITTSYRVNFALGLASTVAALFFMAYISEFVGEIAADKFESYDGSYFAFLVLGIGVMSFLDTSLTQASRRIREGQVLGTLEALLATRTGLPTILVCLPLYAFLETSFRFVLYLILGMLFFDLRVHFENGPAAVLLFVVAIVAFASLGLFVAGLTLAFKRAEPIANLISGLCLFLGGVYYPLEVLPEWLRGLSYLLPITPALAGLRLALLSETAGWSDILPMVVSLVAYVAIMLPIGIAFFRWSLRRAMRDGTLTQY